MRPFTPMRLRPVRPRLLATALVVASACFGYHGEADRLSALIESAANKMTLTHTNAAVVDYLSENGAYWVYIVPPASPTSELRARGVMPDAIPVIEKCLEGGEETVIAVGEVGRQWCVTQTRVDASQVVGVTKARGERTAITITKDSDGYHVTDIK
jgi:hypothetical protein